MTTLDPLTNHWFVRDGSWWLCIHRCGTMHPFPSAIPTNLGPCLPRPWLSGAAPVVAGRLAPGQDDAPVEPMRRTYDPAFGPSPLSRACPKCEAPAGERCRDGRKVVGTTLRPHVERLDP